MEYTFGMTKYVDKKEAVIEAAKEWHSYERHRHLDELNVWDAKLLTAVDTLIAAEKGGGDGV